MVVKTTCAQCGQELELPDLWAGKVIPCPECEVNVRLPLKRSGPEDAPPVRTPRRPPPEEVQFEELAECPMCGAEVSSLAENCARCGESLQKQADTGQAPPAEFKQELRLYQARLSSLCVFWFFEAVVGFLLLLTTLERLPRLPPGQAALRHIIPWLILGCVAHFFFSAFSLSGRRMGLYLASGFSVVLLLAAVVTLLGMAFRGARAPLWPTFVVIVAVKLMILALTIQVLVWHNRLRELRVLPLRRQSL